MFVQEDLSTEISVSIGFYELEAKFTPIEHSSQGNTDLILTYYVQESKHAKRLQLCATICVLFFEFYPGQMN